MDGEVKTTLKVEAHDSLDMTSFNDENSIRSQELFPAETVSLEVDSAREDQVEDVRKPSKTEEMLMKQVQELSCGLEQMKSMMEKKKKKEVRSSLGSKVKLRMLYSRRPKVVLKPKATKAMKPKLEVQTMPTSQQGFLVSQMKISESEKGKFLMATGSEDMAVMEPEVFFMGDETDGGVMAGIESKTESEKVMFSEAMMIVDHSEKSQS